MVQLHNWSITEIENMLPWERDIYLMKLERQLKEEKKQQEESERNQIQRR